MFTADDIGKGALEPGTTYHRFPIERDGKQIGWVRVHIADLTNRGIDPTTHIVDELNRYEREGGSWERSLASGLRLD